MWKFRLAVVNALAVLVAAQSYALPSAIQLSPLDVSDSVVTLQGYVEAEGSVQVEVKKGAQAKTVIIKIRDGRFETPFLLDFGPGTYSLDAFLCRRGEGQCSWLKGFQGVQNRDTRHPSQLTLTSNDVFSVDQAVTSTSVLRLRGELPAGTHLLTEVAKLGEAGRNSSDRKATGRFETKLYLSSGPGTYRLKFYACPSQVAGSCNPVGSGALQVINEDRRAPDSFLLPSTAIQSDEPVIQALARQLTRGARTDREIARAIQDWVTSHVSYDVAALNSGAYTAMSWDAITVLERRTAICQGYTNLTVALLRAAGVPARSVSGFAQSVLTARDAVAVLARRADCPAAPGAPGGTPNHAWNEVLIDGSWLPMDTTWDAGYVDRAAGTFEFNPRTRYFLNAANLDRDHVACYTDAE